METKEHTTHFSDKSIHTFRFKIINGNRIRWDINEWYNEIGSKVYVETFINGTHNGIVLNFKY